MGRILDYLLDEDTAIWPCIDIGIILENEVGGGGRGNPDDSDNKGGYDGLGKIGDWDIFLYTGVGLGAFKKIGPRVGIGMAWGGDGYIAMFVGGHLFRIIGGGIIIPLVPIYGKHSPFTINTLAYAASEGALDVVPVAASEGLETIVSPATTTISDQLSMHAPQVSEHTGILATYLGDIAPSLATSLMITSVFAGAMYPHQTKEKLGRVKEKFVNFKNKYFNRNKN